MLVMLRRTKILFQFLVHQKIERFLTINGLIDRFYRSPTLNVRPYLAMLVSICASNFAMCNFVLLPFATKMKTEQQPINEGVQIYLRIKIR